MLELDRRPDEAVELLRAMLADAPEHGDARYLLGKILLSQGEASAAEDHVQSEQKSKV